MKPDPNSAPSREPNLLAEVAADNLRGPIAREADAETPAERALRIARLMAGPDASPHIDRSEHVEALGPWCDCNNCLTGRELMRSLGTALDMATIAADLVTREHAAYIAQLRAGPSAPPIPPERRTLPTWLEPVLVLALSLVVGTALLVLLP